MATVSEISERTVGFASRVNYPVTIRLKDGSSFVLSPLSKTPKEHYLSQIESYDKSEVIVIK